MSNTGWTPAVPGHTNDIRRSAGHGDPTSDLAATARDEEAPEPVVDLDVERRGEVVVVRVGGEVDMLTAPMLSSLISEQLLAHPPMLVLDLTAVGFLGSSGLAALVGARDEAGAHGVSLRLVSTDHAVLRPLTATGLTELFDIHPDLESALTR